MNSTAARDLCRWHVAGGRWRFEGDKEVAQHFENLSKVCLEVPSPSAGAAELQKKVEELTLSLSDALYDKAALQKKLLDIEATIHAGDDQVCAESEDVPSMSTSHKSVTNSVATDVRSSIGSVMAQTASYAETGAHVVGSKASQASHAVSTIANRAGGFAGGTAAVITDKTAGAMGYLGSKAMSLRQKLKGGSGLETPAVAIERRRLSAGHQFEEDPQQQSYEEKRGCLQVLDQQSITEMLGPDQPAASLGSTPDERKQSFANKKTHASGMDLGAEESGVGYTCRKGLKPESSNQDAWFIVRVMGDFTIYGVCDGHGQKGDAVSNYVKTYLPKLIISDERFKPGHQELQAVLNDAFKKMQSLIMTADRDKLISTQMSGCTCTIVIHDHHLSILTVAHIGDTTAVIKRASTDAQALTRDHRCNLPDEEERIQAGGGRVVFDGYANHRVYAQNQRYPGLTMSRCFGSLLGHAHCGLSCVPEISVYPVDSEDVLILCSDGVWEFIEPREASDIVMRSPPERAMVAADELAKEAWDRWIREEGGAVVDDITVIIAHLGFGKEVVLMCERVTASSGELSICCSGLTGEKIATASCNDADANVSWLRKEIRKQLSGPKAEAALRLVGGLGDGSHVLEDNELLSDVFG